MGSIDRLEGRLACKPAARDTSLSPGRTAGGVETHDGKRREGRRRAQGLSSHTWMERLPQAPATSRHPRDGLRASNTCSWLPCSMHTASTPLSRGGPAFT